MTKLQELLLERIPCGNNKNTVNNTSCWCSVSCQIQNTMYCKRNLTATNFDQKWKAYPHRDCPEQIMQNLSVFCMEDLWDFQKYKLWCSYTDTDPSGNWVNVNSYEGWTPISICASHHCQPGWLSALVLPRCWQWYWMCLQQCMDWECCEVGKGYCLVEDWWLHDLQQWN